jgi:phage shock protein A
MTGVVSQRAVNPRSREEKRMSTDVNIAKQIVHDELESQIKTAEAKLEVLKARAEAAEANVEIKANAALLAEKQAIEQKLQELKKLSDDRWERAKSYPGRMADFE